MRVPTNKHIFDWLGNYGLIFAACVLLGVIVSRMVMGGVTYAIDLSKTECRVPDLTIGEAVSIRGNNYYVTEVSDLNGIGTYWIRLERP